uniref:Uncharacterized protein n=1 Tax=Arundo donax TaxID=35708 RepID=A0A0A9DZI0_ARUDO
MTRSFQCMCFSRAALTICKYGNIVPIQGRLYKWLNIMEKFTLPNVGSIYPIKLIILLRIG